MKYNFKLSGVLGSVYSGGDLLFACEAGDAPSDATADCIITAAGNRVSIYSFKRNTSVTLPMEARSDIHRMALSPDGSILIVIDKDGCSLLINFRRRVVLGQYNFKERVNCIRFSPDGKYFVVGLFKKTQIWKTPSLKKEFAPFKLFKTYVGHSDKVVSVEWSADSQYIITAARDGTAKIFSLEQNAEFTPPTFTGHMDHIVSAFFAGKDNKVAYTLTKSGILATWKWASVGEKPSEEIELIPSKEEELSPIVGGKWWLTTRSTIRTESRAKINCCSLHKNGTIFVVGFSNGVFGLYDVPSFNNIHTLSISKHKINTVSISPDGEWLAFGSAKLGQLLVWEWQTETFIMKQQGRLHEMSCVAYSPNGQLIATGGEDGKVKVWNASSGLCFVTFSDHTAPISSLVFSPNGLSVISASYDGTVRAYDLIRYRNYRIMTPPTPTQLSCLAIDGAGEIVAAGALDSFEIFVWSIQTGKIIDVLSGHEGPVSGLAFNPVYPTLASVSWDKTARVWDIYEGKHRRESFTHGSDCLALAYSPDGKVLCTSSLDGNISFWDVENSLLLGVIDGRRDVSGGRRIDDRRTAKNSAYGKAFSSLSYSSDGTCILAGGNSKYICLYEVSQRVLVKKFVTSSNRSLDGVLEFLNSADMTEAGPKQLLNVSDDESDQDTGEKLPGVMKGDLSERKKIPSIRCKQISFSPTGRSWSAATTAGCLIYSLDDALAAIGDSSFDPFELGVEVTPAAVKEACENKEFLRALSLSLRLSEQHIIKYVFESIPTSEIQLISSSLPLCFLQRFLDFLAHQIEGSHYIETCLQWWVSIAVAHGEHIRSLGVTIVPTVRSIHKAVAKHQENFAQMCSGNAYTLQYLAQMAELNGKTNEDEK
eukprot:TRINITY_DN3471_c0_g1_i1.p1 TRINITY_DN3471_c0_g1~~TRINITY_DN3471_c0_g1_i1.p1  ORF type:complete len:877 (+),score=205.99 TRINITY_DN3471_c0_g1_i1:27-2657(+)